jgi:hypothetical protein
VTLIDGNEPAYHYNTEAAFSAAYVQIKSDCQALVSPENRPKFRAQLQVGHGLYLDAYINPPTSRWHIDTHGQAHGHRLEQNLLSALEATDQYVWIYGEQARWWPLPQAGAPARQLWPEVLAGADSAIARVKGPVQWAKAAFSSQGTAGKLVNLLANGGFSASTNGQPASWRSWQEPDRTPGQFRFDPEIGHQAQGAAVLSGISYGCLIQSVRAVPGDVFVLSARVRQRGLGVPWMLASWLTPEGKQVAERRNHRFSPVADPNSDAWRELVGSVAVPDESGWLVVSLGVTGQQGPGDLVWFDDALAARINDWRSN